MGKDRRKVPGTTKKWGSRTWKDKRGERVKLFMTIVTTLILLH